MSAYTVLSKLVTGIHYMEQKLLQYYNNDQNIIA